MQENTPDYRRSQADRLIGQLETALRDLTDEHGSELHGDHYLEELWDSAAVHELQGRARYEDRDANDFRSVLDYVYLFQLGTAITEHQEWFDDGCIPEFDAFEQLIRRLNKVRRKVAHHRPVSDEDLATCREVADTFFAAISSVHPGLAADFLVDRWEERLDEIIHEAQRRIQSPSLPDQGTVSEPERRRAVVAGLRTQLAGIEEALVALETLVVPAQRKVLHGMATTALAHWRDALSELVRIASRPDLTLPEAGAAQEAYETALREVGGLRERIRAARVGMPTSN